MKDRNIAITKYRKLLHDLVMFCVCCKDNLKSTTCLRIHRHYSDGPLTDYEFGYIAGKHSAYNHILRTLHTMNRDAEADWNATTCREEISQQYERRVREFLSQEKN